MALLVDDTSRVDGPQADVLRVLFDAVLKTGLTVGLTPAGADELAMRALPRIQAALAGAGYVTRDIDDG